MFELINETYKYVIGFILAILLTPVRKLIYAEDRAYCCFVVRGNYKATSNAIIITKWFRRTTNINCGYFKDRNEIELRGKIYLHCEFGVQAKKMRSGEGFYCPHDKIPNFN